MTKSLLKRYSVNITTIVSLSGIIGRADLRSLIPTYIENQFIPSSTFLKWYSTHLDTQRALNKSLNIDSKDASKIQVLITDSVFDFTPYLTGTEFDKVYEFKNSNIDIRDEFFRSDYRCVLSINELEFNQVVV